jgi:anti-sigma B factor antagonist
VVSVAQLEVEIDSLGDGIVVVRVLGEIDMCTTPELMERTLPVAESAPAGMVVDLSEVGFMGAAGLHALEELQVALRHLGGELAVVAPGGIPRRVLAVTDMLAALRTAATVAQARELLA